MAAVAAQYEGRVTVLGIPGRSDRAEMAQFVNETGTGGFTHVVDDDGALWQRFGVVTQPAFAFVAPDGTSRTVTGGMDGAELRQAIDQMLAG